MSLSYTAVRPLRLVIRLEMNEMKLITHTKIAAAVSALIAIMLTSFAPNFWTAAAEQPSVTAAVFPPYPPIARAANASGDVSVEISIDDGGNVSSAEARSGHPLLRRSAEAAAKRWRFARTTEATGKRSITVTFSYQLLPRCSPGADLAMTFYPPSRVEIKHEKPELICDHCSPEERERLRCKNP